MSAAAIARMRALVEALCSDACAGRAAGSAGGAKARAIVREAFAAAGLATSEQPVPGCGGANVIARAGEGARAVLIGAHYDHLGTHGRAIYRGADDNAAAVAALVEIGRELSRAPGGEAILVAFDGEEPPFFMTQGMGSLVFAREPPRPLAEISLAIVMDLVGHAVGPDGAPRSVRESLFVLGAEKSAGTRERVARAAAATRGVIARPLGIDLVPPLSDYEAFRRAGVPFLFLTCGRWRHYHEPTDTPDRVDYDKLAAIASLVVAIARDAWAADRPRYDDDARDHATTVETLLALAEDVGATPIARALGKLRGRSSLSIGEYHALLEVVARLEQGVA